MPHNKDIKKGMDFSLKKEYSYTKLYYILACVVENLS